MTLKTKILIFFFSIIFFITYAFALNFIPKIAYSIGNF